MTDILTGVVEPVALGFSTGTWCAMYCGPVLLPFLLSRDSTGYRRNAALVGLFLSGRLAAYAGLGFALASLGLLAGAFFDPVLARRVSYGAYIACGLVLVAAALPRRSAPCAGCGERAAGGKPSRTGRSPAGRAFGAAVRFLGGDDRRSAFLSGLAVGFHVCPAFWTAAFRSALSPTMLSGAAYFLLFYAGTLPFFVPLLGLPFLSRRNAPPVRIARLTQLFVGAYFVVFAGLIPILIAR